MDFHEKMKEQRKMLNLTQREVASHLGVGQDLYSRYENGKLNFPSIFIPELCYFLKMTPNDLFEFGRYVKVFHPDKRKNKQS